MREIKFRAYDEEENVMVYSDEHNLIDYSYEYFFEVLKDKVICVLLVDLFGAHSTDRCELEKVMQYTGLHDKNGKEIYEGDIVKNHMTDGRINSEEKDYIFEVVWCSSEASFEYRTKADILGNPCCVASNQYRVEVIGNIYENPEVLEMEGENE